VISKILEVYRPSAVVLQCGADSLSGDKLGCFNLTMHGHAHCVQFLRKQNIPLILLGGGGYTVKNVARTWTYETACALGIEDAIDPVLPWNEYFEWFGPRYRLEVAENNMDDLNIKDGSLEKVRTTALEQLQSLIHAPSVGMHDVPRDAVGEHMGFKDEVLKRDDLDERLAQHIRYVYDIQESDTTSEDSDDESWHSDDSAVSSRRRRSARFINKSSRKRMSMLTNQYFEIPSWEQGFSHLECGAPPSKSAKRRFFQSNGVWDDMTGRASARMSPGLLGPQNNALSALMERGGRGSESSSADEIDAFSWDEPMVVEA